MDLQQNATALLILYSAMGLLGFVLTTLWLYLIVRFGVKHGTLAASRELEDAQRTR